MTVTSIGNDVAGGDLPVRIYVGPSASTDPIYANVWATRNVTWLIEDDNTAGRLCENIRVGLEVSVFRSPTLFEPRAFVLGFVVTAPSPGSTNEGGAAASFTVVLTSEPTGAPA